MFVECLVLQDVFEPGRGFGIEVDAHVVGYQRQRRHEVGTESDRADKAVLHAQKRDVVLLGKTDDGVFAVAPGENARIVGQLHFCQFIGGGNKFQTA